MLTEFCSVVKPALTLPVDLILGSRATNLGIFHSRYSSALAAVNVLKMTEA